MPNHPNAPEMKRCPDCQAPNPRTRTTCYACGQGLDQPRLGAFSADPIARACPNCHAAVAINTPVCASCGREMTIAVSPVAATLKPSRAESAVRLSERPEALRRLDSLAGLPIPRGWHVVAAPAPTETTLRLRRQFWGRMGRDSGAPFGVALALVAILFSSLMRRSGVPGSTGHGTGFSVGAILIALLLGLMALGLVAWALLIEEELTVGYGFLQIRKGWNRWEWKKTAQGQPGFLVVRTREHGDGRGGRVKTWTLNAEAGGRSWIVDQGSVHDYLLGGLFSPSYDEAAMELGGFLASHTSWTLVSPGLGLA